MSQLSIEEQVAIIQKVLYGNDLYPKVIKKPDHVPYLPLKREDNE
jgi:hypothetical protein